MKQFLWSIWLGGVNAVRAGIKFTIAYLLTEAVVALVLLWAEDGKDFLFVRVIYLLYGFGFSLVFGFLAGSVCAAILSIPHLAKHVRIVSTWAGAGMGGIFGMLPIELSLEIASNARAWPLQWGYVAIVLLRAITIGAYFGREAGTRFEISMQNSKTDIRKISQESLVPEE